jgi:hypothetical protein
MHLHIPAFCEGEAAGFRAFMHPVMQLASFSRLSHFSGHSSVLCREEAQESQKIGVHSRVDAVHTLSRPAGKGKARACLFL